MIPGYKTQLLNTQGHLINKLQALKIIQLFTKTLRFQGTMAIFFMSPVQGCPANLIHSAQYSYAIVMFNMKFYHFYNFM